MYFYRNTNVSTNFERMDINEIFNIENWEKTSLESLSNSLKNKNESLSIHIWKNYDKKLSPLSLYKLLKSKFGVANGMSMFLKSDSTDNLIHWHYTFNIDKNELHFWGKSSGVEIILKIHENISFDEKDWDILISNIKSSFSKYGEKMNKVQANFEKYTLFINPFTRLNDTLKNLVKELESLDIAEIKRHDTYNLSDIERAEYYKKFNQWIHNVERSVSLGTTIRMLSPVLAESFINTLLLILSKDDFKKDKRLYESLIRQQIDIRVKTLHLNCIGFEKPIDGEAKEFKEFQTLMNNRNDFLHGNIDPIQLMFEDVYFDLDNIPLFKEDEGIITKTMKNYLKNVEAENAFKDFKTASIFIDFVLSHLAEQVRKNIEHFLITRMPGYNNKTQKIGILFPIGLAEI